MSDATPGDLIRHSRELLQSQLLALAGEVTGPGAPPESRSIEDAAAALRAWQKIPGHTLDEIMRMHDMLGQLETAPNLSSSQAHLATAPVLQVARALQAMVEKVRLRKASAA